MPEILYLMQLNCRIALTKKKSHFDHWALGQRLASLTVISVFQEEPQVEQFSDKSVVANKTVPGSGFLLCTGAASLL